MREDMQWIEKLKELKCFYLNNSFEVYFEKQFMVPYFALDECMQQYPEYGGDAIYMVLRGDRLELLDLNLAHDPPVIVYRNCSTGRVHEMDNLWFFPHPVRRDALHMKIVSSTLLEVGILEHWRQKDPALHQYAPVKYSVYDLVTQSNRQKETVSQLDLCYVGASRNVFERLTNHKTILKIYRHTASRFPDKEIFVWILKPKEKCSKVPQARIPVWFYPAHLGRRKGSLDFVCRRKTFCFLPKRC